MPFRYLDVPRYLTSNRLIFAVIKSLQLRHQLLFVFIDFILVLKLVPIVDQSFDGFQCHSNVALKHLFPVEGEALDGVVVKIVVPQRIVGL